MTGGKKIREKVRNKYGKKTTKKSTKKIRVKSTEKSTWEKIRESTGKSHMTYGDVISVLVTDVTSGHVTSGCSSSLCI
jgi:hypothetical protein